MTNLCKYCAIAVTPGVLLAPNDSCSHGERLKKPPSRSRLALAVLTLGTVLAIDASSRANSSAVPSTPLISRAALLSDTDKDNPKISADGTSVSFTAVSNGTVNVWVAPTASPTLATPVTAITDGSLRDYYWSARGSQILYLVDGKNGHQELASVDVASKRNKVLLDTQSHISFLATSPSKRNTVAIGLAQGASKRPDLYALNIDNGKLTRMLENASFSSFLFDRGLNPVIGFNEDASNETFAFAIDRSGAHRPLLSLPADAYFTSSVQALSADGKTLYLLDARTRNTAALTAFDIASGKSTILCENSLTDIKRVFFDPVTQRPLMCLAEYGTYSWTALDGSVQDDIAFLNSHMKGYWSPIAAATNAAVWIVYSDGMTGPSGYEIYDRKTHALKNLFLTTPGLVGASLAATHTVQFLARDGLALVAYLTLPHDADPNDEGKPSRPLPMVLMVHGGPWGRAYQRVYLENQLFANRGYAVLAVQFRGSTGFGRKFMASSYGEWGGAMQNDLLDGVSWAIKTGVAEPGRIAIYGHSYGGYATMLGILEAPQVFACGVDSSGPTDLVSFIKDADEGDRNSWRTMIGDPTNAAQFAMLRARSPLFATQKLKRPLLMIQGGQDATVRRTASDQMAATLDNGQAPFTYVVYPDEGHFFTKGEDVESTLALSETFLANCLGGTAEPLGDLSNTKLQVVYGKEHIPGLATALVGAHR